MRRISTFLLLLNLVVAQPESRMVHGQTPHAYRVSFSVAIFACSEEVENSTDLRCVQHCSGSLLSSRSVLTAAHCFFDSGIPWSNFYVLTGANDYTQPFAHSEFIQISRTVDRGYGSNLRFPRDNDIAIAFLETAVGVDGENTSVVRLATHSSDDLEDCDELIVAGYGRYSNLPEEIRPTGGFLHIAREYMHSPEVCIEANVQDRLDIVGATTKNPHYTAYNLKNREFFVKERSICFGGTSKSTLCNGDSGAPIFIHRANGEYVQVGIASFGIGSNEFCGPSLDYATRVSAYSHWLADQLLKENIDPSAVFESWPLGPTPENPPKFTSTRCDEDLFQCKLTQKECIEKSKVCDGVEDCSDGSDEIKCTASETSTHKWVMKGEHKLSRRIRRADKMRYGIVIRWDPKAKPRIDSVEILRPQAESEVKYDDVIRKANGNAYSQKNGGNENENIQSRRRYGHKVVGGHQESPKETTKATTQKVANKDEHSEQFILELRKMGIRFKPFRPKGLVERNAGAYMDESVVDYIEHEEKQEVSVACVDSTKKMIDKRAEYVQGTSVIQTVDWHENLTDIDRACEEMLLSCLNDDPHLVYDKVGPGSDTARNLCASVENYHDWSAVRDDYMSEFAAKYKDKCPVRVGNDFTISKQNDGLPGPHNWVLTISQVFVIFGLLVAILYKFRIRS